MQTVGLRVWPATIGSFWNLNCLLLKSVLRMRLKKEEEDTHMARPHVRLGVGV